MSDRESRDDENRDYWRRQALQRCPVCDEYDDPDNFVIVAGDSMRQKRPTHRGT
jgi:hypothetical protein